MSFLDTIRAKQPGERLKLALIPLLLAGFGGVLYSRIAGLYAGGSATEIIAAVAASSGPLVKPGVSAAARVWLPLDVEQVIAHNPFRRPVIVAEPEPADNMAEEPIDDPAATAEAEPEQPIETPRAPRRWPEKVQAVFVDSRGAAAIVDARVVRLGDVLESGARVVEISSTAVTFELGE